METISWTVVALQRWVFSHFKTYTNFLQRTDSDSWFVIPTGFISRSEKVSMGHIKPFRAFIAEVDITKGFDSIEFFTSRLH
jgi:hypothetical protein